MTIQMDGTTTFGTEAQAQCLASGILARVGPDVLYAMFAVFVATF